MLYCDRPSKPSSDRCHWKQLEKMAGETSSRKRDTEDFVFSLGENPLAGLSPCQEAYPGKITAAATTGLEVAFPEGAVGKKRAASRQLKIPGASYAAECVS